MNGNKKSSVASGIKWLNDVCKLISDNGIFKVLQSIFVISLIVLTIAFGKFIINFVDTVSDPEIWIEKFENHQKENEIENRNFRIENDPVIRNELSNTINLLGACRASVLEFHNGKKNPSSLGFLYADMTYEETIKGIGRISQQYQNLNLSLINLSTELYKKGFWLGSTEELKKLDPLLGDIVESNGTGWMYVLLLEGSNDLGMLQISFFEKPENIEQIEREIKRLGVRIASKLDYDSYR